MGRNSLKGNELIKWQLKSLGDNAKEVGDKFEGVGEGMSKWVTAPFVAVGVGALKTASDLQSAQGNMQAQLGLTAKEAAGLSKTAKELWAQGFGTDMADVTNKVEPLPGV